MKKPFLKIVIAALVFASVANAKVLVVVDTGYYYYGTDSTYVNRYIDDVRKVDFKNVDMRISWFNDEADVQDRCEPLWDTISAEYKSSLSSSDTLEGVVMVGDLPFAWRVDSLWNYIQATWGKYAIPEITTDDRYFMDLYNNSTGKCYTNANQVFAFDTTANLYTTYKGDGQMDVWVSRIMANQIRGLRNGLTAMDEYTIINNYLDRLHQRMTMPAKVPPRGFAMGGITEWPYHDAFDEFGMKNLHLRNVFDFIDTASTPGNWLLQLTKGPYGGTTLGAFNGTRYQDLSSYGCPKNNITITNSHLWDSLIPGGNLIPIQPQDTFGYEWAGIYEHSLFSLHGFNLDPSGWPHAANGTFRSQTNGIQYSAANWLRTGQGWAGGYFLDSLDYRLNPMNLPNYERDQHAIFKAPIMATGNYSVWQYFKPSPANSRMVAGMAYSWPPYQNFGQSQGTAIDFGLDSQTDTSSFDTNWRWGYLVTNNFIAGDTAWIWISNEPPPYPQFPQYDSIYHADTAGYFIADAIMLAPVPGQCSGCDTIIIDNSSLGFTSTNWKDRSFLDMQDEDGAYHNAISKVPFFISSGCLVGDYTGCYDTSDWLHEYLSAPTLNCLGQLYGMAHSGLISLTSAISYPGASYQNSFAPFTSKLATKDGKGLASDFGSASLAQYNSGNDMLCGEWGYPCYNIPLSLFGAGTLRDDSTAYVPYGTLEIQIMNQQISGTFSHTYSDSMVWLENYNVSPTGNCSISGKEVRIYAESDLRGTVDVSSQ